MWIVHFAGYAIIRKDEIVREKYVVGCGVPTYLYMLTLRRLIRLIVGRDTYIRGGCADWGDGHREDSFLGK